MSQVNRRYPGPGRIGSNGRGGAGLLAAPTPPVLTLQSAATDNQPDFLVSGDLELDDVVTVRAYSDAGKTTLVDIGQGTVTVAGSLTITNQLGPLSDGSYWYDAVTARALHSTSAPSNTENNTIDTTAPTLSSPTGTKTGETTATLTVFTNEGNGVGFVVVTTSATQPSTPQIKAGLNNGGTAAAFDDSQAFASTGVKAFSATGLTGGTQYWAHYVQEDAVGNNSNRSTSSPFTTDAAASVSTWDPANKDADVTLSGGNLVQTNASGNGTYARVIGTQGHSTSGKYYFEVALTTLTAAFSNQIGVSSNLAGTNRIFEKPQDAAGSGAASGIFTTWNQTFDPAGDAVQGDVINVAVDFDNGKVFIGVNNNYFTQNPATGANPTAAWTPDSTTLYPYAACFGAVGTQAHTLHAAASNQTYSPPAGFSAWG